MAADRAIPDPPRRSGGPGLSAPLLPPASRAPLRRPDPARISPPSPGERQSLPERRRRQQQQQQQQQQRGREEEPGGSRTFAEANEALANPTAPLAPPRTAPATAITPGLPLQPANSALPAANDAAADGGNSSSGGSSSSSSSSSSNPEPQPSTPPPAAPPSASADATGIAIGASVGAASVLLIATAVLVRSRVWRRASVVFGDNEKGGMTGAKSGTTAAATSDAAAAAAASASAPSWAGADKAIAARASDRKPPPPTPPPLPVVVEPRTSIYSIMTSPSMMPAEALLPETEFPEFFTPSSSLKQPSYLDVSS